MSGFTKRTPSLPPPPDLRVAELAHEGAEYLVVSWAARTTSALTSLTPSEREVATLAARGLSNSDIADVRGVSVRTVCNQLASAFHKLGVGSRVELARAIAAR